MISICSNASVRKQSYWKLNESILSNPVSIENLNNALREYFFLNDNDEVSSEVLWAAHKTYIKGKIIQISSKTKRDGRADIERLDKEYAALQNSHKGDPTKVPIALLDRPRFDLNLALTTQAEKVLRWNGNKFYTQANKFGPLLAAKISPRHKTFYMPKIRISGQPPTANPDKILDAFHDFYSDLYNSHSQPDKNLIAGFLDGLPISTLSASHKNLLEAPFSEEEVGEVIKGHKKGSAPDPDGLSISFIKPLQKSWYFI